MAILKQRGAPAWELDPDSSRGFKDSVRNGQVRLALEYADTLIDQQRVDINALKAEVEELKLMVRDLARVSTTEEARRGPGRPPKQPAPEGTSTLVE
jgi:hypothetical protein